MILGIMQPYFFPYIGYWQLIKAVDRFIIYDNVNYIKGGWINRNRILINGQPNYITVPLSKMSPFKHICETELHPNQDWRSTMTRKIENTYCRYPYFKETYGMVHEIVHFGAYNLSHFLAHQLMRVTEHLNIETEMVMANEKHPVYGSLRGKERVIHICGRENANIYINAIGGRTLYDAASFNKERINLKFLSPKLLPYDQRNKEFVRGLSIIDMLMSIGRAATQEHLNSYELIEGE